MTITSNDLDKTKVRQAIEKALKEPEPQAAYDWERKRAQLKAQYQSGARKEKRSA